MQGDPGPSRSLDKKRKGVESSSSSSSSSVNTAVRGKKARKSRSPSATRETVKVETQWPDYFKELFKIFKALNTVLAFCTSRKQFATSFNSLRASIEGLLKRPLELEKVAQIKALLPELLTFAYTPANHLNFNGASQQLGSPADARGSYSTQYDQDEHVLVLEMDDNMVRKRRLPSNSQVSLGGLSVNLVPESLDPATVKLLIEKRNAIFSKAVDELIAAFSGAEDPVALLVASAKEHIPLNTVGRTGEVSPIPDPGNRLPIDRIIEEIQEQRWYMQQIKFRRVFDAKEGSLGRSG